MLSPSDFHQLVSGRKSGPTAKLLRGVLRLAEFPYTWVVNSRNRRFDDGRLPVEKVCVPVISVGNLTLGGTGKTPMVQWLARWFQHRRLARDLDMVLVDALEPFGFGHVFPRGTLREPLAGLARAQMVVLTRADMADETERARIRGIVELHAPYTRWAECFHAPRSLLAS